MPFQARHSIYKRRAKSFKTYKITETSTNTALFKIVFLAVHIISINKAVGAQTARQSERGRLVSRSADGSSVGARTARPPTSEAMLQGVRIEESF